MELAEDMSHWCNSFAPDGSQGDGHVSPDQDKSRTLAQAIGDEVK